MEASGQLYPQGKRLCYPLDRKLGRLQSRSGRGGKEKNSQPMPGLELPLIQPVAQRYTTVLSRLGLEINAIFNFKFYRNKHTYSCEHFMGIGNKRI
jgi:hypothetical protein